MGEKRVTLSKNWVMSPILWKGYFYVGCQFIGISYFLTKFGECHFMKVTVNEGHPHLTFHI
jgi:hypothetical protein